MFSLSGGVYSFRSAEGQDEVGEGDDSVQWQGRVSKQTTTHQSALEAHGAGLAGTATIRAGG